MIHVTIKRDQTIPEGYKYIDCNQYTPEEFIRACSPAIKGCINQNAVDYVRDNPRAAYDTEDLYRVRMMPPVLIGAKRSKQQKNQRHRRVERQDPVQSGDMSMRQMAEHCGVDIGTLTHCVLNIGLPYRLGMDHMIGRKIKHLRPSEVLKFMEDLPRKTENHRIVIRRLRQDLGEV